MPLRQEWAVSIAIVRCDRIVLPDYRHLFQMSLPPEFVPSQLGWDGADALKITMASTLDLGLCIEDVRIAGHAQPITLRSYRPASDGTVLPVVLYFHGGGFVRGTLDDADVAASTIARDTPAWVVSVGYSLAPAFPFPAAPEDALSRGAMGRGERSCATGGCEPHRRRGARRGRQPRHLSRGHRAGSRRHRDPARKRCSRRCSTQA